MSGTNLNDFDLVQGVFEYRRVDAMNITIGQAVALFSYMFWFRCSGLGERASARVHIVVGAVYYDKIYQMVKQVGTDSYMW